MLESPQAEPLFGSRSSSLTVTDTAEYMPDKKQQFNIEEWLVYRLWRISQEAGFTLERFYAKKFGLTGFDWRLIAAVATYAPISAKGLAEVLDLSQVQMTRALTNLIDEGLISRRMDKADRRRIILRLTKKGLDIYQQITPKAEAVEAEILSDLEVKERQQFMATLKRIEDKIVR